MRNTRGAKEQSKIILLNLISNRPSTESPRYSATNHSNMDSSLKVYYDNGCDVIIANPCKGILSMAIRGVR